jgi:hypothetical protein
VLPPLNDAATTVAELYLRFLAVKPAVPFLTPQEFDMTTATTTPAEIFQEIVALLANDVFTNALPVITTALTTLTSNPQEVLNPLNAGLFVGKFIADLNATLPTIEASAVEGAAQLANTLLATVSAKVSAAAAATSASTVGAQIAGQITG